MEINVSNYQKKIRVEKKWIRGVAAGILKRMGADAELSIALTDNKRIRRLNRKYRRKDRATDVLSFPQISSCVMRLASCVKRRTTHNPCTFLPESTAGAGAPRTTVLLGDVVISVERAKSQAREYGHTFREEMAILIEHGILHLLGLTHKQMEKYRKTTEAQRH
jgi:probable rRNA maturation factor